MAGIGHLNKQHILKDNTRRDGTGIAVGAGEYTSETIDGALIFADQTAVDTYATARGFPAGRFTFLTVP